MQINKILAIAITDYTDTKLNTLNNCLIDVSGIVKILNDKYQFDETIILSKKEETTKSNIYNRLTDLFFNSVADENILLIYAGHGELHPKLNQTYWQLSDSLHSDPSSWLNVSEIISFFKASQAQHIGIISDSCFSGGLFENYRGGGSPSYKKLKSREALTSGGLEKVTDGKKGEISPFATTVIKVLHENDSKELSFNAFSLKVCELFDKERKQTPRFGPLYSVGDEGGTFVFEVREPETVMDKKTDRNEELKKKLHNLFIPLSPGILQVVDQLNELRIVKNEIVKKQQYEEASKVWLKEKEIIEQLKIQISKIIDEQELEIVKASKFSNEDLSNQQKLDEDVLKYVAKLRESISEWNKKRESEIQEKKEANKEVLETLSGSLLHDIFSSIENPVWKMINAKQNDLIEGYKHNIISMFQLFCSIKGTSKNKIIEGMVHKLKEILRDIYMHEVDLLMGISLGFIKENRNKALLELRILNWLEGKTNAAFEGGMIVEDTDAWAA